MKTFENPTIKVERLEVDDILTTSVVPTQPEDRLPGDDL